MGEIENPQSIYILYIKKWLSQLCGANKAAVIQAKTKLYFNAYDISL